MERKNRKKETKKTIEMEVDNARVIHKMIISNRKKIWNIVGEMKHKMIQKSLSY